MPHILIVEDETIIRSALRRLLERNQYQVSEAGSVVEKYADLGIGLADASIVVLSRRYRIVELLTLDERHFRVLRGPGDIAFRLLPQDLE